jgi:adaptin ear-binding coat-associated protein 1/2
MGGVELLTFKAAEAYVYQVPPARSAAGHRAEARRHSPSRRHACFCSRPQAQDWNVEKWLKQVSLQLFTTSGDEDEGADGAAGGVIRLLEENGELFAECPLPPDTPVNACCEPVVDSSRYYVLRLVDETTKRHAYLGLGFSSRDGAFSPRAPAGAWPLCAHRE